MFSQTGVKAMKTGRVQNAAYNALQHSDPVMNGNEPTYRTRQDTNQERHFNDRFSGDKDANSETCTEL